MKINSFFFPHQFQPRFLLIKHFTIQKLFFQNFKGLYLVHLC